ncbi:MAG: ABC transporter ATP-binding protein [Clostridiales bacterium]|nr:ABC transporter ATP-binding protein [Clostridiales bacterium]
METKRNSKKDIKKRSDRDLIIGLAQYAKPYWYFFLIALALILILSMSNLARPYLIKTAIDDNIMAASEGLIPKEQARAGVKTLGILFILLSTGEFVFGYIQTYMLQSTGRKIIMTIRDKVFSHLQRTPVSYFDKTAVGRIVTIVMNDTESLSEMYTEILIGFFENVFVMVGVLVIMFKLDVRLTLISLVLLPLIAVVTITFRRMSRKIFDQIRARLGKLNAFLSENISGMKIIQAFNMQGRKYQEFKDINSEYYDARQKQIKLFGILRPLMDVVRSLILAVFIWYGGRNILRGQLQFGTLYAFINYINRFFQPIMHFTEGYNILQSAIVSGNRIFDLLEHDLEPEPEDDELDLADLEEPMEDREDKADKVKGEIEFKNVWFAYEEEKWVLKDVSFKIAPGEAAAFVGATGAGKTSIINLICGFYENQKGEILLDGVNIKQIKKADLRKNIGMVLQDVFLFSGDVQTNIRLFNENITQEEVIEAAQHANANYFIEKLGLKYEHPVTEKGTTLSMGQRQLLSFARALVIDPAVLVMDEATSSIDTETEVLIQEALKKIMKGRTTIAIAHRLSTIQNADKIIVIHKGEIREMGTHHELLQNRGLYYNLHMLQYRNVEEALQGNSA